MALREGTMLWRGGQFKIPPLYGVPRRPREPHKATLAKLGKNMRAARGKAGLTQEKLAELVELHPRVVQKLEAGQTNILVTTLIRLQAALKCRWNDLLPPDA